MDSLYDVVMQDDDFLLYENQQPLLTKRGNIISHPNARALRVAISSEMIFPARKLSPLKLLERLVDVRSNSEILFNPGLEMSLSDDPMLQPGINHLIELGDGIFEKYPFLVDYIFLNSSTLASSFNNLILQKDANQSKTDFIIQLISELSIEEQMFIDTLFSENNCGLVIHLLLLKGFLSVSEYAAGIVTRRLKNNHPETVCAINERGSLALAEVQLSITSGTQIAIDFLSICSNKNKITVVEEIIQRGEDDQTEFKSTLRWDIRQEKKNPAIEHASLKTICAFLNSEGGDLLIGVRDDGSIEGIETDQFENDDRFLLHLWNLIKTCMGQELAEWVKTSLQKFGNKTVCRVNCRKAKKPIFLNQKGFEEAFYIRVGPSSSNLEISTALKYINQHF